MKGGTIQISTIIIFTQWFYISYFIFLSLSYLTLNFLSFFALLSRMRWQEIRDLPHSHLGFEPPVSILVPAYNEVVTIVASVQALLQLVYPEFEIIVINDGSSDNSLAELNTAFDLVAYPEARNAKINTRPVRGFYHSRRHPNLRVVDKENGGKADALNVGLNTARHSLFCAVDADSILQRDSLQKVIQPFLEDETTIAAGGMIRIANGCKIERGYLKKPELPRNVMGLLQIVEYLRAFLFGRLGWSTFNGMFVISGAFGLFRTATVLEVGGYRVETVGEDMELVVRLHRHMRLLQKPYRITFVPDPVCWTEVPEDLGTLYKQRVRWQRGLVESLWMNRELLFHPRGGAAGWVTFPFLVIFECLDPLLQSFGYILTFVAYCFGIISLHSFLVFLFAVIALGLLLSTNALLFEEFSFHVYPTFRQALWLFCGAIFENFGYRQMNSFWRLVGTLKWLFRTKRSWGAMKRKGWKEKRSA